MKKLVGILALTLLISLGTMAQEKKAPVKKKPTMTAEQMATLQSKKMALELDLDANQQKDLFALYKKNAEERLKMREEAMQKRKEAIESRKEGLEVRKEKMKKKTEDQRFEQMNRSLDRQMAQKAEMKKILNNDQFEKWSKMQKKRKMKEGQRSKRMKANKKTRGERSKQRAPRSRSEIRRN